MNRILIISNLLFLGAIAVLVKRLIKLSRRSGQPLGWKKSQIPIISLEEVDPIFKRNEFGTTWETEVFLVGRAESPAIGAVSDSEAWVLSALAKKSKNIFEFGTCTGRTTYLLAKNSPAEAAVTTLTLNNPADYVRGTSDDARDTQNALYESTFEKFFSTGTSVASKIRQLYGDSKKFDETKFAGQCDLIFVDGSHAYSYVQNDTVKALKMIKPGGIDFMA